MKKTLFILPFLLSAVIAAPARKAVRDAEIFEPADDNIRRCVNIMPPKVKTIACIAPGSFPNSRFHRKGVELLRQAGYKVKVMPHAFVRQKKVSQAPLEGRLSDFYQAWNDPEVDLILPTRGGTGAQQIPPKVDWDQLRKRKVILMGYSNITCLTGPMFSQKAGYPVQGPNLGSLVSCDDASLRHLKALLAGGVPEPVKLTPLREGDVSGMVYAGHMALLLQVQKSPFKVDTTGRILFIECVRRPEKELKRVFNALKKLGFFEKCAGVVFCHFTRNFPDEESKMNFFKWMTSQLKCPVYYGYPYGHEPGIRALDFQRKAVIKNGVVTFEK